MPEEPISDQFLIQLLESYTSAEVAEIQKYISQWDAATYMSVAQSILDHANRKGIDPLKYLRKAHNFNKKGAIRVPKTGYRGDSSAVYRKSNEYLIVRPDQYGTEKIVTYGVNDD
ncbi:hypothetical protein [Nostoc sp. 'Lobaria pulmonaria (5183) cyanobiont']|uniref:hypothetical protein n=1 Tax=Nostoc sp. 'Lobaria pulmonaria (5183) cyanobiont' TaxID=1618022 RepID=UPI000CF31A71|nr:hypothetical protein [Nostoc sp. 'Lobaria pulmonaria (5183) cyanobiont']AVH71643.1 hypothetical protein NLP_3062 [Nostoc sp. 'Lobaria pulmonaria (5183) cyanobiont']